MCVIEPRRSWPTMSQNWRLTVVDRPSGRLSVQSRPRLLLCRIRWKDLFSTFEWGRICQFPSHQPQELWRFGWWGTEFLIHWPICSQKAEDDEDFWSRSNFFWIDKEERYNMSPLVRNPNIGVQSGTDLSTKLRNGHDNPFNTETGVKDHSWSRIVWPMTSGKRSTFIGKGIFRRWSQTEVFDDSDSFAGVQSLCD
jgi:hypothetical protein